MEKNGNTFAPGDPVRYTGNTKIASAGGSTHGRVVNLDPDTEMVEIEWESGGTGLVKMADLKRA